MLSPQQQTPQFDIREALPRKCPSCGHEYFNLVYRLGMIPAMALRNQTRQDLLIKTEAYMCRECGNEYGKDFEGKK